MPKFQIEENVSVSSVFEQERAKEDKGKLLYVSLYDNGTYIQIFSENCNDDNLYYKLLKNKVVKEYIRRNGSELYVSVY